MNYCIILAAIVSAATVILAQDGPVPPRLQIPGAISLGPAPQQVRSSQFRNSPDAAPIRVRRPVALVRNQQPSRNILDEAKPVTEEPEDEYSNQPFVTPHHLQQNQPQALVAQHHQQNIPAEEHFVPTISQKNLIAERLGAFEKEFASTSGIGEPRFVSQQQQQPQQQPRHHQQPNLISERLGPIEKEFAAIGGGQRFAMAQQQPRHQLQPEQHQQQQYHVPQQQQSKPVRRPAFREPRPQFEVERDVPQQQTVRRQQDQTRPKNTAQLNNHQGGEKKPVAQILRKYREENEDGSITWGFENDDGSFKEEIIGIDCVTRGRYGYVDPDGNKREYNYETGIQCDPNKRGQSEEEDDVSAVSGGYIDYQDNSMVLANGQRIGIGSIGKNKIRKPVSSGYRN